MKHLQYADTGPVFDLLAEYGDGRRMALWSLCAVSLAVLAGMIRGWTPWLALSARLWLAYSAGHMALWICRRQGAVPRWQMAVLLVFVATAAGAIAGLPLAHDFVIDRLRSPKWLLQRSALPLGFGLAMHVPAFLLRLREWTRHRQQIALAESAAARSALQRQVTLAELKTLQAQVEPHFLFNTLASVEYLVRHDPARASDMLGHLHEHLRQSLPAMRSDASTLRREMGLARSYLSIMQIRLAGRLEFSIELPDDLADLAFPPMMLSSLVENAVKHGIEPLARGGTIRVFAERREDAVAVAVSVSDDGAGLARNGAPTTGSGIGLSNLQDRLAALYGTAASFSVASRPGGGVMARVVLPAPH